MIGIVLGKMQMNFFIVTLCLFLGVGFLFLFPKKKPIVFLCILFFALGYGMSFLEMSKTSQLEPLHNETADFQAYVMEPPVEKENKKELYLKVEKIYTKGTSYPIGEEVLASIYCDKEDLDNTPSTGDMITFQGKARIPKGVRNPGGFDYSLYLRTKGIYATITIFPETIQMHGKHSLGILSEWMYWVKNHVEESIEENLSPEHAGLLRGILFGEKELDSQIQGAFVQAGIAHVLAVSGLHVGFLIGFISAICNFFKVSNPIKFAIYIGALLFYILITGGTPSVIRASIMAWISLLSKLISKKYDGISALSLAGLVILVSNPLLLYTASFQLSFLASLFIILLYSSFLERLQRITFFPSSIQSTLGVTIAAQLGILPASLYHFHEFSVIALITNLVVIPLIGVVLLVSILAIISYFILPFIGKYLFFLAGFAFQFLIEIAETFSSIPFASISLPSFTWWGMIIYIFLLLILGSYIPLQIKKVRWATFGTMSLLLICILISIFIKDPLKVTFLDVGQGDSALIETPNHKNILIDGGGYPSYQGEERKISEKVLLPALQAKRIRKLDLAIVSHPHDDHIKGIEELVGNIPIDALGIYDMENEYLKRIKSLAVKNGVQILNLKAGNTFNIGSNITLEVLSPLEKFSIEDEQKDINNASLVLKMEYQSSSFLFTGDIEQKIEKQLVTHKKDIEADVLKVPHHGSDTSSSKEFIKEVSPDICVISLGENNTFGHPSLDTIETLENITPYIYRTDREGAVEVSTNGNWIKVRSYQNE